MVKRLLQRWKGSVTNTEGVTSFGVRLSPVFGPDKQELIGDLWYSKIPRHDREMVYTGSYFTWSIYILKIFGVVIKTWDELEWDRGRLTDEELAIARAKANTLLMYFEDPA